MTEDNGKTAVPGGRCDTCNRRRPSAPRKS